MKKIYVDKNNQAMFICPMCGFEKIIDAMNLRGQKDIVKGECRCKETYQFVLEYRRHHRKDVSLSGEYIVPKIGEKGSLTVRQLSLTGIQFESLKPHQISKDDILEVKFKLNDQKESEIRKQVKVIWVKDSIVGGQFTEITSYQKDLGFFLRF
jgi:predicted RNA-binding Zn-ribbon protein involved in translation (DUF1610 family)